ncbi:unnamed protein product [Lathyrus sativus]|nr:unnamed protein product [Lathyrus sativus]
MLVLVNRSATKDFKVGKGLRQGDPLSPFLFIIVMKGLTKLMKNAMERRMFHGFKVNEKCTYSIMQFTDDTLIVGKGSWDNRWYIKVILMEFEMVTSLKVNFSKRCVGGINLKGDFVEVASNFL